MTARTFTATEVAEIRQDIELVAPVFRAGQAQSLNPKRVAELLEHCDAMLSAFAERLTAEAWQDISTAPKDGTKVLLWVPRWSVVVGSYQHSLMSWWDGDLVAPTHWRPLPAPPVERTGE